MELRVPVPGVRGGSVEQVVKTGLNGSHNEEIRKNVRWTWGCQCTGTGSRQSSGENCTDHHKLCINRSERHLAFGDLW
jgi:hypothetical protein